MSESLFALRALLQSSIGGWVDAAETAALLVTVAIFLFFWGRRKLDARAQEIEDLKEKIAALNTRTADIETAHKKALRLRDAARARRDAVAVRIPALAVQRAWAAHKSGDEGGAAAVLRAWWQSEHRPTAELHGALGEWYALFAKPDDDSEAAMRKAGAARALAVRHLLIAAHLVPEQSDWADHADQLALVAGDDDGAADLHGQYFTLPAGMDQSAARALVVALLRRSDHLRELGQFWAAFALATRAGLVSGRAFAPSDPLRLACEFRRANALSIAGQSKRALAIAWTTLEAEKKHPDLGPTHPSTLTSGALVASILHALGRNDEAIPIAKDAWEAIKAHSNLGPTHPQTLTSGLLVAYILRDLGHYDEALSIAVMAWKSRHAHGGLGRTDPETLVSGVLVASILRPLGRKDEALYIAKEVWEASKANGDLGPTHPQTLTSELLVAMILSDLGRNDEALPIAEDVWKASKEHSDLGARHYITVEAEGILASILHRLGRNDEAGPLARHALGIAEATLAPTHRLRRDLAAFVAGLSLPLQAAHSSNPGALG